MSMALSSVLATSIVKLFTERSNIEKYYSLIERKRFSQDLKKIIEMFHEYFEKYEEDTYINQKKFILWADTNNKFSNSDIRFKCIEYLEDEDYLDEEEQQIIIERLNNDLRVEELKTIISDYENGREINLKEDIKHQVELFDEHVINKNVDYVQTSINELFKKDIDKTGFKWAIDKLNNSMTPLQPGDFGIIAARPDSGKTSFIASQVVNFAKQTDKPILWLNNEGINDKIKQRCVQSSLRKNVPEIIDMIEQGVCLDSEYEEATIGGDKKIQIVGIHGKTSTYIEKLIENVKPSIIIFDMIDNVKFIGHNHLSGTRTDQILETMYQWARNLGVIHNCVVLATSQVSSDGEGMAFPTLGMLKDSKTGKQGACDFCLMIGRKNDNSNYRYLSLPKNKLAVSGKPIDPRAEVYFDYSRCVYNEVTLKENFADDIEF